MDTLSHGLWAAAAAKGINLKSEKKIKSVWMGLWGVFPDISSFAPVMIWMLWQIFYNGVDFGDIPRPETMPPEVVKTFFIFRLTRSLYCVSHSLVIFLAVFLLIWLIRWYKFKHKQKSEVNNLTNTKRYKFLYTSYLEMTGWFLHIIADIPTHSKAFYPTKFLWPLSDWCFDGVSWANMKFIITNYTLLIIAFILLKVFKKMKVKLSG